MSDPGYCNRLSLDASTAVACFSKHLLDIVSIFNKVREST